MYNNISGLLSGTLKYPAENGIYSNIFLALIGQPNSSEYLSISSNAITEINGETSFPVYKINLIECLSGEAFTESGM